MHRMVRCIIALAILVGSYGQTVAQAPVSVAQHPLAGARVFGAKGCVKCHAVDGVGGTLGPDLGRNPLSHSFFDFAAAMWNHLPQMAERMSRRGLLCDHGTSPGADRLRIQSPGALCIRVLWDQGFVHRENGSLSLTAHRSTPSGLGTTGCRMAWVMPGK